MPTNYTGDPAGSNAPSPVPGPENFPIAAIPIATEGRTVSAIAQAFKTLADHIAWLKKPFGNTTTSQRFQQRWRTAVGHTRFALDRNGLPAGTWTQFQERWFRQSGLGAPSSAPFPGYDDWVAATSLTSTGGIAFIYQAGSGVPTVPSTRTGVCSLRSGDVLNDFCGVQTGPICTFHADADIAFETVVDAAEDSSPTRPDLIVGILNPLGSTGTDPRTVQGVYFLRDITKTNWQAVARDGSGETMVDTGIAVTAGAMVRVAIQFRGANVNDGAAKGAYFFLEGFPFSITTNVPSLGGACASQFAKNTQGTAVARPGAADFYMGPVHLVCNVMPSVTT